MRRVWLALAGVISRYHFLIVAVALVATVVLALGLPRIHFKTGQDTFLPSSSKVYQDNLRYQGQFGGDPMLVLFEGDVLQLLSSPNVETLRQIEQKLGADSRYFSVVSPLTIVQLGVEQIKVQQEAALAQTGGQTGARGRRGPAECGGPGRLSGGAGGGGPGGRRRRRRRSSWPSRAPTRSGSLRSGRYRLDNPKLVEFVLFDADGNVRPEMADIIPDR